MSKKLGYAADISINSPHDSSRPDKYVEIEIHGIAKVEMTLENFGLLMSGLGRVDCAVDLSNLDIIKTDCSRKTVDVTISVEPFDSYQTRWQLANAAREYEKDGWFYIYNDRLSYREVGPKQWAYTLDFGKRIPERA